MDFRTNHQLQLALNFLESTGVNIFLTGKAGTGKTTFLHNLKRSSLKRMVVVAPTGVAAINAGGVTIHSFFQLPFGPQLPNDSKSPYKPSSNDGSRLQRFSREKIDIIRSLDLLVIDEVSMVRADLLDGIDGVLRRFKNHSKPFGGVQLLMIGDLQQLAPIAKEDEWAILKNYYDTVFFFSSKALKQTEYISIELKEIFRQSDKKFITLLNQVRNNELSNESIETLNTRHIPNFQPDDKEGYITLTTHNHQAQSINAAKLNLLKTKPETFSAEVEGDFPEHAYPTDYKLTLKEGAQVMFVKNDPSHQKLFFNGKIGTLVSIEDDIIYVQCPNDQEPIAVTPLEWDNTKYTIDSFTKEIKESVAGRFVQYPLKLAWAITIHKSQGLTFDRAIIDAQAAFTHGQVYVALSRCRSLEGIVLSTPIASRAIINDEVVIGFNKNIESNPPTNEQLTSAQLAYQKELLCELFDFLSIKKQIGFALSFVKSNTSSFHPELPESLLSLETKFVADIYDIAQKFINQIVRMADVRNMVENNSELQERVKKAIVYFLPKIEDEIIKSIDSINTDCDNKELRSRLKDHLDKIYKELNQKLLCLRSCERGFSVSTYIGARAKATLENYKKKKTDRREQKTTISSTKYPDLYLRLKAWRDALAKSRGVQVYRILPQKSMLLLATELPYAKSMLKKINGIGPKKIVEFGDEIISMILEFRKEQGLSIPEGDIFEDNEKSTKKVKSHFVTFQLFQSGKTIEQIAVERDITESTVANHLTPYIESGDIKVETLVSKAKIESITEYFENADDTKLGPAKDVLGDDFSYNEIRWVLKYLQQNNLINKLEEES